MGVLVAAMALVGGARAAVAETPRVERNVVFGMYSGLALLLDVHHPERPNGYGVLFVSGSGWTAPLDYGAAPLKHQQVDDWAPPLLAAGYTVFAINHRASPRFHYPAALEDVQRAIRFIRRNAKQYGVDPARLAGVGGSSGGHLIALAAMRAAAGVADDADPVNRESAALQCLVLRAAPVDLGAVAGSGPFAAAAITGFLGRLPTPRADDQAFYRAASPLTHVSSAAPPVLLVHGDKDDIIPLQQSEAMESALRTAGVPVAFLRVPGGVHSHNFASGPKAHPQFDEVLARAVEWLDRHLRHGGAAQE